MPLHALTVNKNLLNCHCILFGIPFCQFTPAELHGLLQRSSTLSLPPYNQSLQSRTFDRAEMEQHALQIRIDAGSGHCGNRGHWGWPSWKFGADRGRCFPCAYGHSARQGRPGQPRGPLRAAQQPQPCAPVHATVAGRARSAALGAQERQQRTASVCAGRQTQSRGPCV